MMMLRARFSRLFFQLAVPLSVAHAPSNQFPGSMMQMSTAFQVICLRSRHRPSRPLAVRLTRRQLRSSRPVILPELTSSPATCFLKVVTVHLALQMPPESRPLESPYPSLPFLSIKAFPVVNGLLTKFCQLHPMLLPSPAPQGHLLFYARPCRCSPLTRTFTYLHSSLQGLQTRRHSPQIPCCR